MANGAHSPSTGRLLMGSFCCCSLRIWNQEGGAGRVCIPLITHVALFRAPFADVTQPQIQCRFPPTPHFNHFLTGFLAGAGHRHLPSSSWSFLAPFAPNDRTMFSLEDVASTLGSLWVVASLEADGEVAPAHGQPVFVSS